MDSKLSSAISVRERKKMARILMLDLLEKETIDFVINNMDPICFERLIYCNINIDYLSEEEKQEVANIIYSEFKKISHRICSDLK